MSNIYTRQVWLFRAIKGAMIVVTSDGSGSKLLIREHKKDRWMIHDGLG